VVSGCTGTKKIAKAAAWKRERNTVV
jgi:hypothetical protein